VRCGRGLAFDEQGRDSASLLLERINAAIAAAGFAEAETIDGDSLKAGDEVGEIVGPAVGGSGRAVDIDHAREGCVAGAKVRKCCVLGGCGDSFAFDRADLLGVERGPGKEQAGMQRIAASKAGPMRNL